MTDAGTSKGRRASSSSGAASSVASAFSAMDRRPSFGTTTSDDAPPASSAEPESSTVETRSRKRAASIEVGGGTRRSNLALDTPPVVSDGGRDFICLCTPAPKVPRPRNAFILYRQHHQGQVVAQNPGLANPEISKIIGEQWRVQPEEVKEYWKNLAEEEKLRHQRQYPDYRYQPRRGAKAAGRPGSTAADDPGRCPKCGGRYIATPKTPSTPLLTPASGRTNMQPYMMRDGRSFEGEQHRHTLPPGKPPFPYHQGGLRDIDEEYDAMSPSSDIKRRRYNQPGQYQSMTAPNPFPGHHITRQTRQGSIGGTPCPSPSYGSGPLPGPSSLARQGPGGGGMGPPPRPGPYIGPSRIPGFDESLRLPPLQTQMPPPTPTQDAERSSAHPLGLGITNTGREGHNRSLEAHVMAIPFINKLRVLDKISPAFAPPNPMSPEIQTRGAIIAVEGPDARLLEQVGTALHRGLLSLSEVDVKSWVDGGSEMLRQPEEDTRMESSSAGSSRKNSHEGPMLPDMYVNYMQKMVQWHEKSRQMVKHITTLPGPGTDGIPGGRSGSEGGEMVVPGGVVIKTPVALLPAGFSLTISDRHASQIPIADSYLPVDHWQWMATLWRGIVGPDLVVYVKPCVEEELSRGSAVEIRGNELMIVKVLQGSGFDEKMDRRVCFEVVEWLRGSSFKAGFGFGGRE